jgi:MFS transporter, DHA1 family, inner membrane transport protein
MDKKERTILILLAALNFTHILDFMIMMPLGNYLMPYFKISGQKFSMIVAAYSFAAFVSGIIASFFVDRYDRKKVLLFGYSGFLAGTILCGFSPTANTLLIARAIAGLFGGLIGAQVMSIVADIFIYEKRGKAMGYLMSAFSLASVLGIPAGLFLANLTSWHAPFRLIGILGILLIPLLMRFIPSMDQHLLEKKEGQYFMKTIKNIMSNKRQLLALSLSGCMMLGHFLLVPFINPFMEFNVGFSKDQTQYIYIVGGLITMFSGPYFGRMADKYGKTKIFTITALISLVPIIMITNMPAIHFYYVLVVTGVWFMVANGRSVSAIALVSNVVPPQTRGSFMSINSSMQQLFTGMASTIAGFIIVTDVDTGKISNYNWVGYLSALIILGCVFIANKVGDTRTISPAPEIQDNEDELAHSMAS